MLVPTEPWSDAFSATLENGLPGIRGQAEIWFDLAHAWGISANEYARSPLIVRYNSTAQEWVAHRD